MLVIIATWARGKAVAKKIHENNVNVTFKTRMNMTEFAEQYFLHHF